MIKFSKTSEKYGSFSNFHKCPIWYEGIGYQSAEAVWQSLKTSDEQERKKYAGYTATEAQYNLMVKICRAKFTQNPDLGAILLSTCEEELVENTTGWHDNIWGNCECPKCVDKPGENLLGKALMEVRAKLDYKEMFEEIAERLKESDTDAQAMQHYMGFMKNLPFGVFESEYLQKKSEEIAASGNYQPAWGLEDYKMRQEKKMKK